MYDVLLSQMQKIKDNSILDTLDLEKDCYGVFTTHRQENTDFPDKLLEIIEAVVELSELTLVFPIHPRTEAKLRKLRLLRKLEETAHIKIIPSVGYHEMQKLIKDARLVLTDSGGMQKEAFWLKTLCITLRDTTEWVETLDAEANVLVGANKRQIVENVQRILHKDRHEIFFKEDLYGDGKASERILKILHKKC